VALFLTQLRLDRPNGRTQEFLIPEANRLLTHNVGSVWQVTRPPDRPAATLSATRPDQDCRQIADEDHGWVKIFSENDAEKAP
jgi:hypothetical protein